MRSALLWSVAAVATLLAAGMSPGVIQDTYSEAIVYVESVGTLFNGAVDPTMTGTGFLIAPDLVLTALHITLHNRKQDFASIKNVVHPAAIAAKPVDAMVIDTDPANDLAVLKVNGPPSKAFVPLGDSTQVKSAATMIALGYPVGADIPEVNTGILSGRGADGRWHTQILATPRSSGSPVFDDDGRVIGVVLSGFGTRVDNQIVQTPSNVTVMPIKAFQDGLGKRLGPLPTPPPPAKAEAKSARVSYIVAVAQPPSADAATSTQKRTFDALSGYRITQADVMTIGEAGTTNITSTVGGNGANVTVQFTMTRRPGQTAWFEAVVRTQQTPARPVGH